MTSSGPDDVVGAMRNKRGFHYGIFDFLSEVDPGMLEQNVASGGGLYLQETLLSRREKEIAILAACIAAGDHPNHIAVHFHAARNAGASGDEMLELIKLITTWVGNVRALPAFEAWRIVFRPDLPPIDRIVALEGSAQD